MSSTYSLEGLKNRLEKDARVFDQLINAIPAKFYISGYEEQQTLDSKYTYGKRKTNKVEIKKKAELAKKAKFDVDKPNGTIEHIENNRLKKEEQNDFDDVDAQSDASFSEGEKQLENKADEIVPFSEVNKQELRQKLKQKIEQKRSERKADNVNKVQKAKLKRQNKKLNKKKEKEENKNKPTVKHAPEKVVVDEAALFEKKPYKSADSIKEDAAISFSKFEFECVVSKKKGPSTAHNLLQKAEAEQRKLEAIKAKDEDKANALIEKNTWKKAIQLASGEKVRDDVKLLKKTIKREQKIKHKSTKEWNDRKNKLKEEESTKQTKRNDNIQKRIDAKKNKRLGIKPKKEIKKSNPKNSKSKGKK